MPRLSEQRRAKAAELTHTAIVDAARDLFTERGYGATTIDQIAKVADVSPATVYAVTGGKRGLIRSLVDRWAGSQVLTQAEADIATIEDAGELVRYIAEANRCIQEDHGDVIRILLATAASNADIASELESSTTRYRATMRMTAERLSVLGVPGEVTEVRDVMWFYFGFSGFITLIDDNGWSVARAEAWLTEQCTRALGLEHSPAQGGRPPD